MVKDDMQTNVTYTLAYGNRICLLLIYVIYVQHLYKLSAQIMKVTHIKKIPSFL